MASGTPKISIITATFNRAHFIEESLDSILNQSFRDWECLVIDDGSSDNTPEILKNYSAADPRIKFFKRTQNYRKGLPGCRNQGLDLAVGEYVVFFDDDDIVHPENLQTCVDIIEVNDADFCRYNKKPFRNGFTFSFELPGETNSSEFNINDLPEMITGKVPFASCCVLWNKRCFEKHKFNEELMYAEEWECYSRILAEGFKGVSIEKVLYFNRKHPESNTGEFQERDPVRRSSKVKAAKLIINQLTQKELFREPRLQKFFIRLGFELGELSIIKLALKKSNSSFFRKLQYNIGFYLYPVIRPILKIKSRL